MRRLRADTHIALSLVKPKVNWPAQKGIGGKGRRPHGGRRWLTETMDNKVRAIRYANTAVSP